MIKFENVSYYYDADNPSDTAISNLSFEIHEGEFVALCGHNGSGKSTAARLMNGLLTPTSGKVTCFGMDTADKSKLYEIRKKVGMVFQNPDNQMIATIVEDDIAFGPENIGIKREEIIERVNFALESVGMSAFSKKTPYKLSGGQKQRIAIAGILAIKPNFIVLDESTAMLDPVGRKEVLDVIKTLNTRDGIGVILITHFMDEAAQADRIIVLDNGKKVLDGTPKEVFANKETIENTGLKLPRAMKLADALKKEGVDLGEILTTEELVDKICQL